jgi:hypothetical protein
MNKQEEKEFLARFLSDAYYEENPNTDIRYLTRSIGFDPRNDETLQFREEPAEIFLYNESAFRWGSEDPELFEMASETFERLKAAYDAIKCKTCKDRGYVPCTYTEGVRACTDCIEKPRPLLYVGGEDDNGDVMSGA